MTLLLKSSLLGGTGDFPIPLPVNYGGTGVITSTGTGAVVLSTSPTFVTPILGVAAATSLNKVAFTAPASAATLTLANGSTLVTSGAFSLTLVASATTVATLPAGTHTLAATDGPTFTGIVTTSGGRVGAVRVVTAAGAVTVTTADETVILNKTVGAATVVNLMATPTAGTRLIIKDGKGDAAANNITVTPAAGTIDGAATAVMNANYMSLTLVYGVEWSVV